MTAEQDPNPAAPNAATRLRRLALSARSRGNLDQARDLCRQSLLAFEATLGTNHPELASTLNSLARIHEDRGEYAEAELLYERAIQILENADRDAGAEQLLCWSLSNLANLYRV